VGSRGVRRLLLALPVMAAVAATPLVVDPAAGQDSELLETGRELYETGCASCHGNEGEGVVAPDESQRGPSLQSSGEAAAYYYLTTGRMPLANSEEQPTRKDPAYDDAEIEALVAYVGSLGDGPRVPEVDIDDADLAAGGEIFRANCQACHSASGSGGALSYGRAAPRLADATPTQVAAAVRVGPGQMPVFGDETIDDDELDDLAAYVDYLRSPEDPGGLPIGRTGPIPEGFVAWLIGMVALVALVMWIGTRNPIRRAHAGDERGAHEAEPPGTREGTTS
jgi:ubiquinol-cytochrome c reductase cytochrome c subunit